MRENKERHLLLELVTEVSACTVEDSVRRLVLLRQGQDKAGLCEGIRMFAQQSALSSC